MFHGYISIDPKESETQFQGYVIKNKIGNVYIGKPENPHKVNVLKKFEGHRITIAFDVLSEKNVKNIYEKYGKININTGLIPILL